eukprot:scaffold24899_cov113-Cylindrotheca_fusiformis.AAC.2
MKGQEHCFYGISAHLDVPIEANKYSSCRTGILDPGEYANVSSGYLPKIENWTPALANSAPLNITV